MILLHFPMFNISLSYMDIGKWAKIIEQIPIIVEEAQREWLTTYPMIL
jgi:hypothetical protein